MREEYLIELKWYLVTFLICTKLPKTNLWRRDLFYVLYTVDFLGCILSYNFCMKIGRSIFEHVQIPGRLTRRVLELPAPFLRGTIEVAQPFWIANMVFN
jgi:hypothetical protein